VQPDPLDPPHADRQQAPLVLALPLSSVDFQSCRPSRLAVAKRHGRVRLPRVQVRIAAEDDEL
jgi:hypothetical protein